MELSFLWGALGEVSFVCILSVGAQKSRNGNGQRQRPRATDSGIFVRYFFPRYVDCGDRARALALDIAAIRSKRLGFRMADADHRQQRVKT